MHQLMVDICQCGLVSYIVGALEGFQHCITGWKASRHYSSRSECPAMSYTLENVIAGFPDRLKFSSIAF